MTSPSSPSSPTRPTRPTSLTGAVSAASATAPTGATASTRVTGVVGVDPAVLWQDLADALNALITAGHTPAFHNRYGSRNHWQHQPYLSTPLHSDAPWVVFDLARRSFVVSTRADTLRGTHDRRPRRRTRR
ncbi:hypothetical protein ABT160_38210 [Streptomyces sp. NPDC001941]|uniref:hypothetical protein n=1 Tax=Streptomyces sp. NPDC001941 TaxID=3154659 RepID=UPI003326095B